MWTPIYLASRNLDRSIMTASQVLCFSCIWMDENFLWMICTMRSISLGVMGRVRDCSRRRFITCVVNSLQACNKTTDLYGTVYISRLNHTNTHCWQTLVKWERKGTKKKPLWQPSCCAFVCSFLVLLPVNTRTSNSKCSLFWQPSSCAFVCSFWALLPVNNRTSNSQCSLFWQPSCCAFVCSFWALYQ